MSQTLREMESKNHQLKSNLEEEFRKRLDAESDLADKVKFFKHQEVEQSVQISELEKSQRELMADIQVWQQKQ